MTKKCRNNRPTFVNKFMRWIGSDIDLHQWTYYRKQNEKIIYFCRRCDCGIDQVQKAGPIGDMSWQDTSQPFRWSWERRKFDEAKNVK